MKLIYGMISYSSKHKLSKKNEFFTVKVGSIIDMTLQHQSTTIATTCHVNE
jgi:hypothetical protein